MSQYIQCDLLKSVFRIEKLDAIKRVCGYDIKNLSSDYQFFHITLDKIDNETPTLSQKMTMLKNIIHILIEQMKDQNVCVIQLSGDLCEGDLPEYYQYILTSEGKKRYYCPELIYNRFAEGYIESWISFDFNEDLLKLMPFNHASVILEGLIISPHLSDIYNTFFKPDWANNNLESLLKQSIIYFSTDNDFEYFSVASKLPMELIIKKWENGLKAFLD